MLRRLAILSSGILLLSTLPVAEGNDQIELLDGTRISTAISSIGADGKVVGERLESSVNVNDIRTITRTGTGPQSPTGNIVIDLSGGGRLRAKGITVADEKCEIAWGTDGTIDVPIDLVRAVRFDSKPPVASFQSAIEKPTAGFDRLFVKDGERVQTIAGLIDKVEADSVVFLRDSDELRLPRSRVYGLVLAEVVGTNVKGARCKVTLRDGSIIPGAVHKLADGLVTLKMSRTNELSFPWEAVIKIDVQSPRLTYLSDLKPAEVVQRAVVTVPRNWQRNRTVTGGGLSLNFTDEQTNKVIEFARGIGTHSLCRLTYDLGGEYDTFLTTVGIDPNTHGKGDCVVQVTGDGETLYTQRVTGQDRKPHELRLNVEGVQSLIIAVEPGQELDLADRLNWCDARLIRKPTDG